MSGDLYKVLYCSFDVIPEPTGSSARATEFIRAVSSSLNADGLSVKSADHAHIERFHGMRLMRVPVGGGELQVRAQTFERAVRRQLESDEYQIVHFTDPFGGYPLCELKHQYNFKLVYEVVGFPSIEVKYTHPQLEGDRRLMAKLRRQELFCLMNADAVVVGSEVTAAMIQGLGVSRERITVIPTPADLEIYATADLPPPDRVPMRIVYVGSQTSWQGLSTLLFSLPIVARSCEVRLAIVGPQHPSARLQLDEMINHRRIGHLVEFIDPVAPDDMPKLMASADVGVAPLEKSERNTLQGAPVSKISHYAAAGRPVVVSELPMLREITDESFALYHRPGDEADLARRLVELANDPARRVSMGEAARAFARERLGSDRTGAALLTLYSELLAASGFNFTMAAAEEAAADAPTSIRSPFPEAPREAEASSQMQFDLFARAGLREERGGSDGVPGFNEEFTMPGPPEHGPNVIVSGVLLDDGLEAPPVPTAGGEADASRGDRATGVTAAEAGALSGPLDDPSTSPQGVSPAGDGEPSAPGPDFSAGPAVLAPGVPFEGPDHPLAPDPVARAGGHLDPATAGPDPFFARHDEPVTSPRIEFGGVPGMATLVEMEAVAPGTGPFGPFDEVGAIPATAASEGAEGAAPRALSAEDFEECVAAAPYPAPADVLAERDGAVPGTVSSAQVPDAIVPSRSALPAAGTLGVGVPDAASMAGRVEGPSESFFDPNDFLREARDCLGGLVLDDLAPFPGASTASPTKSEIPVLAGEAPSPAIGPAPAEGMDLPSAQRAWLNPDVVPWDALVSGDWLATPMNGPSTGPLSADAPPLELEIPELDPLELKEIDAPEAPFAAGSSPAPEMEALPWQSSSTPAMEPAPLAPSSPAWPEFPPASGSVIRTERVLMPWESSSEPGVPGALPRRGASAAEPALGATQPSGAVAPWPPMIGAPVAGRLATGATPPPADRPTSAERGLPPIVGGPPGGAMPRPPGPIPVLLSRTPKPGLMPLGRLEPGSPLPGPVSPAGSASVSRAQERFEGGMAAGPSTPAGRTGGVPVADAGKQTDEALASSSGAGPSDEWLGHLVFGYAPLRETATRGGETEGQLAKGKPKAGSSQ